MTAGHIDIALEGGIRRITINRPARRNALTHAMYSDLAEALASADLDPATRVICLGGADGNFTSGNDLQDFMKSPPASLEAPVFKFLDALRSASKPVVAEVRGVAIGIGTTLLLHCDLVYCDESARFQLPFVNLGLCPEAGSSLLLPGKIGHQLAAELLMLGEVFDAHEASRLGLVNRVVASDELSALTTSRLLKLAAQPPAALRLTKALLKETGQQTLMTHMQTEAGHFMRRLSSPEALEAMAAFSEKRAPDFSRFQ